MDASTSEAGASADELDRDNSSLSFFLFLVDFGGFEATL